MRACFLGQNICALGFGVATLQMPPLMAADETGKAARADSDRPVDQNGALRPAPMPLIQANPL
jgi:hypothetical protein